MLQPESTDSSPPCTPRLSGLSPFLGDDDTETLNNVLAANWYFDEETFESVSDEAKDFVSNLIIKDKRCEAGSGHGVRAAPGTVFCLFRASSIPWVLHRTNPMGLCPILIVPKRALHPSRDTCPKQDVLDPSGSWEHPSILFLPAGLWGFGALERMEKGVVGGEGLE